MSDLIISPPTTRSSAVDAYPGAQSVSRAIALLKSFSDARPEWSLADLARKQELNKSTTYRLLAALEAEGLLLRTATGAWRLGPELIVLGHSAARSNDLLTVSRDLVARLAEESGETSTLEILAGRDVIILEEVSSRYLLGMAQEVGARLPAHATSTGKLMLAHADAAWVASVYAGSLPKLAADTLTTLTQLEAEFIHIRRAGYATSHNELEPGFVAVAAPLIDHAGVVRAAVSIGAPEVRLNGEAWEQAIALTCRTAEMISRRLGWQGAISVPATD